MRLPSKRGSLVIETMDGNEEWVKRFAGLLVIQWEPGIALTDPEHTAFALRVSYDDQVKWTDKFSAFLADGAANRVAGLVVGAWSDELFESDNSSAGVVSEIVAAHGRLANLKAVFLGDIISEETEISWLHQSDVSPLLLAYPQLEHFCVRGAEDLVLGTLRHQTLRSLVIQCGGLPLGILSEVLTADLPALEHLELWLGTENYGWNGAVTDLAPIFSGSLFPNLRYLGLRDSEIADQIAVAIAQAPILQRIDVLDLSLGTLSDEGALALIKSPLVSHLKKLDVHRHFCSEAMVAELGRLGIEVDASEREEPDRDGDEEWRYVAVGE
jgi:hypothetical protein